MQQHDGRPITRGDVKQHDVAEIRIMVRLCFRPGSFAFRNFLSLMAGFGTSPSQLATSAVARAAWCIDVEQMNLAVMRDLPAVRPKHDGRVVEIVAVALRDTAGMDRDAVLLGEAGHEAITLSVGKVLGAVVHLFRGIAEERIVFRQNDEIGLLLRNGLFD